MSQPHWSGIYEDMIYIKNSPDVVDVSDITETWIDRREVPFLEVAASLYGCKIEPTDDLKLTDDGRVAQIWMLSKA